MDCAKMRLSEEEGYKVDLSRHRKKKENPLFDFLVAMLMIICSSFFMFLIFHMLHQSYMDSSLTESLLLVNRVETKILKARGDRAEIDHMICEIREDLAKVYDLINESSGGKHPKNRSESPTSYTMKCEKLPPNPNSNRTPFACALAHLNGRLCGKFLKNFRATEKKPTNGEVSKDSMSGESGTFPMRIRRAANPEETTPQADDFWFNYAGDPSTSCKVPKNGLKTAEILCKIWPQFISCNMYCVYGSTYPEGIGRALNCSYANNRWSDYFEECQPFVNCKLRLVGPGTLKCIGNQVNQTPSCHVGCDDYEDNEGYPPKIYTCNVNGTWAPPLPPCVIEKSGVDLAKAPKVLEHKIIEYPKMQSSK